MGRHHTIDEHGRPRMLPPLEDPSYTPEHPQVNGTVPPVVAKWGVRSQRRWFHRFGKALNPQRAEYWAQFYCDSDQHRGLCCSSCIDEQLDGYDYGLDGRCCCEAIRAEDA